MRVDFAVVELEVSTVSIALFREEAVAQQKHISQNEVLKMVPVPESNMLGANETRFMQIYNRLQHSGEFYQPQFDSTEIHKTEGWADFELNIQPGRYKCVLPLWPFFG